MFRVFRRKGRRNFSAVKTCWRRECDSNSHYRFEFRNPRRLPNLQAVQHLTRESTGSDWPLGRQKTAHLFLRSSRRTVYDSVAESGHLGALAKGRHWVRNDYLLGRSVRFPLSELTKKANKSRFSEILAHAFPDYFRQLAGKWSFHLCDRFRVVLRGQSRLHLICRLVSTNLLMAGAD
jgi:hypothetical protein